MNFRRTTVGIVSATLAGLLALAAFGLLFFFPHPWALLAAGLGASGLAGALLVWLLDRRLGRRLRQLRQRLAPHDPAPAEPDELTALTAAFETLTARLAGQASAQTLAVTEQRRLLEASAALTRVATAQAGLEVWLTQASALFSEHFGCRRAELYLWDADGSVLHLAAHYAADNPAELSAAAPAALITPAAAHGTLQTEAGPGTWAALPLRVDERGLGVVALLAPAAETFTAERLALLQQLTDQIAAALETQRQLARQQRRLQMEALVLSLASRLHQTHSAEAILESAATELGRTLGARRAVVRLYAPAALAETDPPPGTTHAAR